MATVETIITRVEKRLAIASGIDVQTHAEDKLVEMIRHKYNTLFDDHWWYDYLTLETFALNSATGLITGVVTNKILRFIDIHSIFLDNDSRPLPLLNIGSNPTLHTARSVAPYNADPTKMFKIYPLDQGSEVHVWYRTRIADDAWDLELASETNVNMDDELLILGTVYDFLADDGSNTDAVAKYERQFVDRMQQLVTLGFQHGLSKFGNSAGTLNEWAMNG